MTITRAATARITYPPQAPYPPGNNGAGNIAMAFTSKQIMHRWMARKTGRLDKILWHARTSGGGYAAGDTGLCLARTHPVLPDGTPDTSVVLKSETFQPSSRYNVSTIYTLYDIDVTRGQLYCTVFSNVHASPVTNFWSLNHAYIGFGLTGSSTRNEMASGMADQQYGLDSREAIGVSEDGGLNWSIPGETNPSAVVFNKNLLTYAQLYDSQGNGHAIGVNPFYTASLTAIAGLTRSMIWGGWTGHWQVTHIALWLEIGATQDASLDVLKNGVLHETITGITGTGDATVRYFKLANPVDLSGVDGADDRLELRALWRAPGGIYGCMMYSDDSMKTAMGMDTVDNKNMFWMDTIPVGYNGVSLSVVPLPGPPGFGFV